MNKKIGFIFIIMSFFVLLFVSCGKKNISNNTSVKDETYYILFINYDDKVLSYQQYHKGDLVSYEGDTPVKPSTIEYNYIFNGWDKEIHTCDGNETYKAQFEEEIRQYSVTFVDEDGITVLKPSKLYDYNTSKDDIELPDNPIKDADQQNTYYFNGWDKQLANVTEDVTYKATYSSTLNKYSVTFVDEDGITVLKPAKSYDYGTSKDDIELPDTPTKEGNEEYSYIFSGWNKELKDVTENVTYKATYTKTPNTYSITINNKVNGSTYSYTEGGSENQFGDLVSISLNDAPANSKIIWTRSDEEEIDEGNGYLFSMPSHNITITILTLYQRNNNKIYFGSYPQNTVLPSDDKYEYLQNLVNENQPSIENGWIAYDYYINSEIKSFMYYLDVDFDNDGFNDYRGVYLEEYRPYSYDRATSTAEDSYQDDNGYFISNVYWFKYQPIEWIICEETNGKSYLVSNLALDSQDYMQCNTSDQFNHNGGYGYGDNYELSYIRKWLNDNFYNTAFNDYEKEIILETLLDNNENTKDKVFIFSKDEYNDYNLEGYLFASDYAKSQGLEVSKDNNNGRRIGSCACWSRTPQAYGNFVYNVNDTGNMYSSRNVYCTYAGVRPCIWLNLE